MGTQTTLCELPPYEFGKITVSTLQMSKLAYRKQGTVQGHIARTGQCR